MLFNFFRPVRVRFDNMKIVVDPKKCRTSGECVLVCPENAISILDGVATIDESKCDLDGICILPALMEPSTTRRKSRQTRRQLFLRGLTGHMGS